MGSSDAVALNPAATPAVENGSDAWARRVFALALILPWWLPVLADTTATFYKELLTVLLVGFAGVVAAWPDRRRDGSAPAPHPLFLAALAIALALVLQSVLLDDVWRKAAFVAVGVLLLVVSLHLSIHLRVRFGERTFAWLATCVAVAALGSCVFAGVQLFGLDAAVHGVVARIGNRLYGNVAQANQFADLLWVGAIGVVWLAATRRLRTPIACVLVAVLVFFVVTSGSRTVWLYIGLAVLLAVAGWRIGGKDRLLRRMAAGLVALAIAQTAVSAFVLATDLLAPLRIATAEQRSEGGDAGESNQQRLWFWRSGLATASEHPWLGVGVGRLAGAARERVVATPDAPAHGADVHAHNVFVQVAAELGIPAGLAVLACVVAWLALAWGSRPMAASTLAAMAMACVMLVHANLEHPFGYLYVLALFGAIAGQIPMPARRSIAPALGVSLPLQATRVAAFVLIVAGVVGYITFMPVERATQVLKRQVAAGKAPQPDGELAARLNAVHDWSPYADFAETLGLMASVPTEKSAAALAVRCEKAARFAPTPYLLARCAADLQVAGQVERAGNFARSLCRIYPEAEPVLRQSTALVASVTAAAAALDASCDRRR